MAREKPGNRGAIGVGRIAAILKKSDPACSVICMIRRRIRLPALRISARTAPSKALITTRQRRIYGIRSGIWTPSCGCSPPPIRRGIRFTGNVGFLFYRNREYRFATYLGASVRKMGERADDAQSTGRHCLSCGVHADARESSDAAYGDGQCRSGV